MIPLSRSSSSRVAGLLIGAGLSTLLTGGALAQTLGPQPFPTGLPPTGTAGGDLSGTYPNPTVTGGSHITNASIPNSGLATPAPCTAFGTTAGTCAQGGVITGAGPTGSATVAPVITYNSAGQLTTVTSATVTPAVGSVTGLGTGVATALGANTNTTGGLPVQTGPATWTVADASGATLTITTNSANYTRLGNMVFAYISLTFPVTANGSSALLSGLPIAVPNVQYANSPTVVNQGGCAVAPASIIALTLKNTSTLSFLTALGIPLTNANLSTCSLQFTLIYPVQ